jgi:uncharacterized surface protein with fasciclin (FAS1) repeats
MTMKLTTWFSTVAAACLLVFLTIGSSGALAGPPKSKLTIFDQLPRIDGSQALIAAVGFVDAADVCEVKFAELLDSKKAQIVLLAPGNEGFEVFLNLRRGALQGLGSEELRLLLPSILADIGLDAEDVCNVLLKHVSVGEKKGKKGKQEDLSAIALLDIASLTVEDGSKFPVGIGSNGVTINYEGAITQPDVYTQNGVIHFLNSVIQDAPSVARVQVFVTSAEYNGNLGNGIVGADAKCSTAADQGNLPGSWTAWLSADEDGTTINARDRIPDGEYQLLDGTVVATSLALLTDGSLDHPINIDQYGSLLDGVPVWTGTSVAGSLEGETCSNDTGSWRSSSDEKGGQVGDSSGSDAGWTNAGTSSCAETSHLYCFAAAETESGNEPPPDTGLGDVCFREWCEVNEELNNKCEVFLAECLSEAGVRDEECIAAAYFMCHNDL